MLRAINNELIAFWCDWKSAVCAGYGATGAERKAIEDYNLESKTTEVFLLTALSEEHAKRIKTVLQGKSYMNLDVQYGIRGGPEYPINVSTKRAGTTGAELIGMVANILANDLKV